MKYCETKIELSEELESWVDKINDYLECEEAYVEDAKDGLYLCFKSLDDLSFLFTYGQAGVYFFNGIFSAYATCQEVTLDIEETACIVFCMRDCFKESRFLFDLYELREKLHEIQG